MEREEWRPVVGHEGVYEVSSLGRVRSLDREWEQVRRPGSDPHTHRKPGRILRPGRTTGGHLSVAIGKGNSRMIHQLVAEAFLGTRPTGMEVRHLNGEPTDNRVSNLEWNTRSVNSRDKKWHNGAKTYKLSPSEIVAIKISLRAGTSGASLARAYGVSQSCISHLKLGRTHGDVNA